MTENKHVREQDRGGGKKESSVYNLRTAKSV